MHQLGRLHMLVLVSKLKERKKGHFLISKQLKLILTGK